MFPREWHTYRPAKDIGWNEYFVTFKENILINYSIRFSNLMIPLSTSA
ncbi:MAG: hypothetical protein ACLRS8_11800 [Parabacteroides merdae]